MQGHSTTDYVLSESIGSVFSTGFISDDRHDGQGGCKGCENSLHVSAQGPPAPLLDSGHMAGRGGMGGLFEALASPKAAG